MKNSRQECCEHCYFWYIDGAPNQPGLCRRLPPSPLVVKVERSDDAPFGERIVSHFPPMLTTGWCGEWRPEFNN